MKLERESANSVERLYNDGRIGKKDVTKWVRLSAKLSGRVYQPVYRSGAVHDRLWLRRREDAEDKLFAKRAGYWRASGRDPSSQPPEVMNINRRYPGGISCHVKVYTPKVRRGYDLVTVILHDSGMVTTNSANRLTSTAHHAIRAARAAVATGPARLPSASRDHRRRARRR